MTMPSHADIQTGALSLPVLTVSRWSRVIALLVAIALIGGVACLQFGSERIPLGDVARILLSGGEESLTGAPGARPGRDVLGGVGGAPPGGGAGAGREGGEWRGSPGPVEK